MPEEYNEAVAEHYAAFRPPLHLLILKKLFKPGERLQSGLDIGCGTGYSAIALSDYCDQVIGIDPSKSMIQQAVEHPSIEYIHGKEDQLVDLASESIDIVTFAGSLLYAKNLKLYQNLLRILKPKGAVVVYDFEILLDSALKLLGLQLNSIESDYKFIVDLSD
ncbi:class I SAM-dependent methyltransferase [Opitutales bacterium]|nr:class I SAM-dependent methyltransferase [Opitutales bacterium]